MRLERLTEDAQALLGFLTEELPLHRRDEEQDMFRLLKPRCRPDDGFDGIVSQLTFEHGADKVLGLHLVMDLRVIAEGKTLETPMRVFGNLCTFAEGQWRHIAWENAVVLPLAHARLTSSDSVELGRKMATRRSISYPG